MDLDKKENSSCETKQLFGGNIFLIRKTSIEKNEKICSFG